MHTHSFSRARGGKLRGCRIASDINSLLAAGAGPSRVKTDSKAGTYPDTHCLCH